MLHVAVVSIRGVTDRLAIHCLSVNVSVCIWMHAHKKLPINTSGHKAGKHARKHAVNET